jgi:hypothetical protein
VVLAILLFTFNLARTMKAAAPNPPARQGKPRTQAFVSTLPVH